MSVITTKKPRGKHKKNLFGDAEVQRWYNNMARGSLLAADTNLSCLGLFCERNNITPKQIVKMGKEDIQKMDNLLLDDVTYLETKGHAPLYITRFLKVVRSWLSYNYITTVRKIKVKDAEIPVTLETEVIPTMEKLEYVINSAIPRARTIICFVAFAGLRPEVLGMYRAVDGLKISDIEGLQIMPDGKVSFESIPAKITIRRPLSKAGHQYFTYLPKIGCDNLAGYLRERIAKGEIIIDDSPVITAKHGHYYHAKNITNTKFMCTGPILKDVRTAFDGILKERPYVLRSYFDSHLLEAENNNKIAHAYRQFFMGHKGDIEARYTTNKKVLPESMLTDMRKAYVNSLPYLLQEQENPTTEKSKQKMFLEMWRDQAKLYGIDPDKLQVAEKQRMTTTDNKDDNDENKEKINIIKEAISKKINTHEKQQQQTKIVTGEEELLLCMNDGYTLIKELTNNRFLVRY